MLMVRPIVRWLSLGVLAIVAGCGPMDPQETGDSLKERTVEELKHIRLEEVRGEVAESPPLKPSSQPSRQAVRDASTPADAILDECGRELALATEAFRPESSRSNQPTGGVSIDCD